MKKNRSKLMAKNKKTDAYLGARLKTLRKIRKLVQTDLSKSAKISQSLVCKIERGELSISREDAVGFAKALDMHPAEILFPELEGMI